MNQERLRKFSNTADRPSEEKTVAVLEPDEVMNFARLDVLVTLFDGDPDAWLDHIVSLPVHPGSMNDVVFLRQVKRCLDRNTGMSRRLRELVREVRTILDELQPVSN